MRELSVHEFTVPPTKKKNKAKQISIEYRKCDSPIRLLTKPGISVILLFFHKKIFTWTWIIILSIMNK